VEPWLSAWGGLGEEREAAPPAGRAEAMNGLSAWGGLGEERRALPPSWI
jgi:hypothetical protein